MPLIRMVPVLVALLAGCAHVDQTSLPQGADAAPDPDGVAAQSDASALCLLGWPDAGGPSDPPACPVVVPEPPDRLDEALAGAGTDRCSLRTTAQDLAFLPASITADVFRLPFFDLLWRAPLRAVPWARHTANELDSVMARRQPVTVAIQLAASRLGHQVSACAPGEGPESDTPLADAVADLVVSRDGTPDVAGLRAAAAGVPEGLQVAVARVVRGLATAAQARDQALALVDSEYAAAAFVGTSGFLRPPGPPPVDGAYLEILRGTRFDYAALYQGAVDLALAIDDADLERFAGSTGFAFRAETPLGLIVINDAAIHLYHEDDYPEPILLLLDTGGDDVYQVPAGATADELHGLAVAIDLEGADRYGYVVVPHADDLPSRPPSDAAGRRAAGTLYGPITASGTMRQGAAGLGIGFLYDLGTAGDEYVSLALSQGFGVLGVGVLWDQGGDDRYVMEAIGQGTGIFGIGLLLDSGGADERRIYTRGQGMAFVRGVGALVDAGAEDDTYYAEPDDPLYYSPQLPGTANSSFVQGAGFGRRDDIGGIHMSGGLGMLRDQGGRDRYTAGVFGQGTAYWFATGILADAAGDDHYDGKWYVQGSAAHFGLALFLDEAGDDRYNQELLPVSTSIGVGHDFSVGVHLDGDGDDHYRAPRLSLGSGNMNGTGLFINLGGADTYRAAAEPSCPAGNLSTEAPAGSPREQRATVGLFLDIGGTDVYDITGSTIVRGDDRSWTNDFRVPSLATERSFGLDASSGEAVFP